MPPWRGTSSPCARQAPLSRRATDFDRSGPGVSACTERVPQRLLSEGEDPFQVGGDDEGVDEGGGEPGAGQGVADRVGDLRAAVALLEQVRVLPLAVRA